MGWKKCTCSQSSFSVKSPTANRHNGQKQKRHGTVRKKSVTFSHAEDQDRTKQGPFSAFDRADGHIARGRTLAVRGQGSSRWRVRTWYVIAFCETVMAPQHLTYLLVSQSWDISHRALSHVFNGICCYFVYLLLAGVNRFGSDSA